MRLSSQIEATTATTKTKNQIQNMTTTDLYNITLNAASQKSAEQIKVSFTLIQNMGYGPKVIADELTNLRQAVSVMRAGLTDRQSEQLERARLERTGVEYDAEQGTIAEEFSETVGDLIDALNISDYTCALAVWDDASTRAEFVILNEHRGDYITRINWERDGSADIHGTDDPAQATTYTHAEAETLIAELGAGFAIEEAAK
jgi:hypothetical protein